MLAPGESPLLHETNPKYSMVLEVPSFLCDSAKPGHLADFPRILDLVSSNE